MSKSFILLLGLISAVTLSARTLTSSDGKKTIEAEVVDFNPNSGKVVLRMEGSIRNTLVDATTFTLDDQLYFEEFLKEANKRKLVSIKTDKESVKEPKATGSIYIYDKRKESFTIKVANGNDSEIKNLVANFDIYVTRYNKEGKKIVEVVSGKESIDSLTANYTHEFTTPTVLITTGCSTTSSCPKCEEHAASVNSERVIGIHVRLTQSGSEGLISEHYSSSSVKTAAAKKTRDSSVTKK